MSRICTVVVMTCSVLTTALAAFSPPATAEVVRAVEYYHQAFEHYFVTANPAEIAALDSGAFSGWWRTGQRYQVDTAAADGLVPVCRFFTSAYAGKGSHFFTASASECAHVKTLPDWTYEGVAFYSRLPDASGNCIAGTAPVNRLFNGGQGGAPNHAYTADPAKRTTLIAAKWVPEGVAYCVPLAAEDASAMTGQLAGSTWDLPVPAVFVPGNFGSMKRVQFAPITADALQAAIYYFPYYGLAVPPTSLPLSGTGCNDWGCSGSATWDPLTGEYVLLFDGDGFYVDTDPVNKVKIPREWWGMMLTFDDAKGPTTPVCTMAIGDNGTNHQTGVPHPFQPYLFSGCEPGVANRL
jgi:hypothetical protein